MRSFSNILFAFPGLIGEFEHPVQTYMGPMMTALVDKFADMDGQGYGVRIEMAPVHIGLASVSVPWMGGRNFKVLLSVPFSVCFGFLSITRFRVLNVYRLSRRWLAVQMARRSSSSRATRIVVKCVWTAKAAVSHALTIKSQHAIRST